MFNAEFRFTTTGTQVGVDVEGEAYSAKYNLKFSTGNQKLAVKLDNHGAYQLAVALLKELDHQGDLDMEAVVRQVANKDVWQHIDTP